MIMFIIHMDGKPGLLVKHLSKLQYIKLGMKDRFYHNMPILI